MSIEIKNSFGSRAKLTSGAKSYTIFRLPALEAKGFNLSRLPFSLKILLENLLRHHTTRMQQGGMPLTNLNPPDMKALIAYIRSMPAAPNGD